jgi:hypothetical protein
VTVIAFPKKEEAEPRIWVCNCECEAFWLYEDGRIQCMQCEAFADTMKGQWSVVVAEEPKEPA